MAKIIYLRYPSRCRDCGAHLPIGSRARYYGRGRIYGCDCHRPRFQVKAEKPAATATWDKIVEVGNMK